ncbi:uncharacterized protein OCT59_026320 [Rhizophagus irregularis]|uniref:Uncharacterized protein n=2 Tax=Rhizophagus irregularis TaxID=588596 RepID=A0A015MWP5_RHIIW|nr:hypothetical protein GLOIN_2v1548419 [Rhizophagus irregularis DAOM 181602=DAOM 197198]EXX71163.1 hypothetical protein RirG_081190 [Rhizophagus irregularis DAOM 197198w]POG77385.1 hypothetical protein GLOIN_2v1548419 [Rhizophagus irregularis DAOM 181602=DAOM 197198]UZO05984.1 hypothetical protein OCT59_026320 [Rhizophagus irregularis]GBC17002.1 hypothetical protein GLOIN_2v1548419 [Rhizophagus irregularis DAOM 181602=DAOM 197198]|eukprot:XP_025184251.1 hypothetical protein GLOIN_2v1548419 [Rhizophagus irregularis DAOM 181602=DAOM 197198]
MGRRKLFNGPLSSILTLITLLFLISFVVGQAPAPAVPAPAPAPAKAPAKEADAKKTKEPAKANTKAPAKGKAKEDDAKNAKDAKGAKGAKDAKGAKAKVDPKAAKAPAPPAAAAPPPPPAPPVPAPAPAPAPVPAPDQNLAKQCNDCWTNKRSELPACKGISKDEFTAFNKSPNSPKVASCLCLFANSMASVFDNECSAVCVDQKLITDLNNQASQYKTAYKCDDKGNSILGSSSNLVGGSGNQTASAISNNINENNMVLGLSFMIGMVLFLIFN